MLFDSLDKISEWESKGLSDEKIKPPLTADKSLSPKLAWINGSRIRLRFTVSCLRQKYATYTSNNVVNLFIVYELNRCLQDLNAKFTLKDCLLGALTLTRNANPNKHSNSGYRIGFDSRSMFSIPNSDCGKNVVSFGVDMSSSVHANNKSKDILILSKGRTKELGNTSLTAEAEYSVTFSRSERKFWLSLHIMEATAFYLLIPQKYISPKQKILK